MKSEEEIFETARHITPGEERQAFLDEACVGNSQLRANVDQLLQAYDNAGSFLGANFRSPYPEVARPNSNPDLQEDASWLTPEAELPSFAPCTKPDRIGQIRGYEVISPLGQGGMGSVWKAWDTKLHRVVALKILASRWTTSASSVARFVREARLAVSVNHDHVVKTFAVDDSIAPAFIAMEYVDGRTLQEMIAERGALTVHDVIRLAKQIAMGLEAAHEQGLIHRDIKPSNILVEDSTGHAKISDFRLARIGDDDSDLTRSGLILGTPKFMSPEQARGDRIDKRSDLFSLGSVIYTMCTGKSPFSAETTMGSLQRVCFEQPEPISAVNPDIPEWLAQIVSRLLKKKPEQRFESSRLLIDALLAEDRELLMKARRNRWILASLIALPIMAMLIAIGMNLTNVKTTVQSSESISKSSRASQVTPTQPRLSPLEVLTSDEWEWTEPVKLGPTVNSPSRNVTHPTMSDDGLTLIFSREAQSDIGVYVISVCKRETVEAPFSSRRDFWDLNENDEHENQFSLSPGEKRLVFTRLYDESSVWSSQRESIDEPFESVQRLEIKGTSNRWNIKAPYLTQDGLELFFGATRKDHRRFPNSWDLYRTSRQSTQEAFGRPVKMSDLNSDSYDNSPFLTSDGCVFFFHSRRADRELVHKLYCATRPDPSEEWGPPQLLPDPVNKEGFFTTDPCLSADGTTMIFSAYRGGERAQLWQTRRVLKTSDKW